MTVPVPQTFDLKPSVRSAAKAGSLLGYPDELMIQWGNTPIGSTATLYWPQAHAIDAYRLGLLLYAGDTLRIVDPHTIQCTVQAAVTYIPIPFGTGAHFGGVFNVELPAGTRRSREIQIVVRRVRTRQAPAPLQASNAARIIATATRGQIARDWRYITGTFQVTIPIAANSSLLWQAENTFSIIQWRFENTPATNRWHPVLKRYLSLLSRRVVIFGGNPSTIVPSPTGIAPPSGIPHHPHPTCYTGKVSEVIYDCFGDFEGFILKSCEGCHRFKSREKGIGDLVLKACRERLRISVFAEGECGIRQIVISS
jgi:hypothetical protein